MGTGLFAGARNAKDREGGVKLGPGKYVVEIDKCLDKKTRKVGNAYIAEYTVVETSDPIKHPVGAKRSWFRSMQDTELAFPHLCEFAYAVMGYDRKNDADKKTIDEKIKPNIEDILDASIEKNAFKGKRVTVEVTEAKGKDSGRDYLAHDFSPAPKKA